MIKDSIPSDYEKYLVELMAEDYMTLSEALEVDFWASQVNIHSVYDVVDYLEQKLENLDKVQYYMSVYTGQAPDVVLKKR